MALIKYYNLESQSWGEVSDLERNLQKHLLDERRIRGLLETDVEDVAKAKEGNGDEDTLAMLLYDSGDFDVLYRESRTISEGKKQWFRKNVAPRIGTEMVVRARPEDILELQDYLGSSGFEVVEARGVSNAIFEYRNLSHPIDGVETYFARLQKLVDNEFPGVKFEHATYPKHPAIELSFSGDVENVCRIRDYIIRTKFERVGGHTSILFLT